MSCKYHVVGLAGVGMNPLTQLLLARGFKVTGSDRFHDQGTHVPVLDTLRCHGAGIYPQDGSGIDAATTAVVVSTAIEQDNPDIEAARRHNIPILHRAELLAQLAAGHQVIGIAGTAGKTTVTGMVGWVLERLSLDPTVVNGGALINWRTADRIGNFRHGRAAAYWVLELDESDRSLLQFQPDWAVITNISKDHFELAEVQALFEQFAGQVKRGVVGPIATGDKSGISKVMPHRNGADFMYNGCPVRLQVTGLHNVENAVHCIQLCALLGLDTSAVAEALSEFRGIERRLEFIGVLDDIAVYDDYAHNPVKIAAAWDTLKAWHRRVIAVWRPHGFGPLNLMWEEWLAVFSQRATNGIPLFLLPVFFVGGTADRRRDALELATALRAVGVDARYMEDYNALSDALCPILQPGDALLVLGARDPELPRFARDFLAQLRHFRAHGMPDA